MHKIPSSVPPTAHTGPYTLHACTRTNQRISALNMCIWEKLEGNKPECFLLLLLLGGIFLILL